MYTAHITMTGKGYHPKDRWSTFHEEKVTAWTLAELKDKLKERYGKSWTHKRPMYRDKTDGSTVRCGWVVGFRTYSYESSQGPRHACLQQDWISLSECQPIEWKPGS